MWPLRPLRATRKRVRTHRATVIPDRETQGLPLMERIPNISLNILDAALGRWTQREREGRIVRT